MRKLLISFGTLFVLAVAGRIYLQNNKFNWEELNWNKLVIPKISFWKKKSYSKVLYKGVISKAANNYKTYAEVVKKFDAFENKTTCSINIPSGISLKNDTGKYQTYLLSLNNYSDGNGFSKYKLDNDPIFKIPEEDAHGITIYEWKIPYSKWHKYNQLFIRYKVNNSRFITDNIYDLNVLNKVVQKHLDCREDIGDIKSSKSFKKSIADGYEFESDLNFMRAIKSNLTSLQEASKLAVIKTNLLCRERLEGKLTKEQKGIYFQTMGINKDNLSDPLVIALSNELKKYISSDCRSIDEKFIKRASSKVRVENALTFNPIKKVEKIPLEQFGDAVAILSSNLCKADKGFFKTKQEFLVANGLEFQESKIPLIFASNQQILSASNENKTLWNDDCSDFIDPDIETVGKIILKYFEQQ